MNIKKSKLSKKSKQKRIETATDWNKNINRVVVSFKPSDNKYYQKWCSLSGNTNLEKIKHLLDSL